MCGLFVVYVEEDGGYWYLVVGGVVFFEVVFVDGLWFDCFVFVVVEGVFEVCVWCCVFV